MPLRKGLDAPQTFGTTQILQAIFGAICVADIFYLNVMIGIITFGDHYRQEQLCKEMRHLAVSVVLRV